jgi:hypothetical protein
MFFIAGLAAARGRKPLDAADVAGHANLSPSQHFIQVAAHSSETHLCRESTNSHRYELQGAGLG